MHLGEEDVDVSGRVKVMEIRLLSLSHGGSSRSGQSSDVRYSMTNIAIFGTANISMHVDGGWGTSWL